MVVIRHYAPNAEGLVHLQKAGSFQHSHRHGETDSLNHMASPKHKEKALNFSFYILWTFFPVMVSFFLNTPLPVI